MTVVAETCRYIAKRPGIRGGHAHVEGTRIGVHDVIGLLQNGETVDLVIRCLPGLSRAQVYECLAYYEDHGAEIDLLIARATGQGIKAFLEQVPDVEPEPYDRLDPSG